MKFKSWLILGVAAIAVVGGGSYFYFRDKKEEIKWRTATVRRGEVRERVSATGTLSAILQVDVGTQVSGMVTSLSADFNSIVKKDQVIATIDPTTYTQRVQIEEINLEQRRITLDDAQRQYDRHKRLAEAGVGLVSAQDLESRELTFRNAKAQYDNATVSLEQAKTNLGYCTIRSPVDGVVVSRKADVGNTVTASMSTPNLFVIAEDLSKMKLEISIDEADISNVSVGQVANFTVDAFGPTQFVGAVSQVRLEPVTNQNVVSYRVVVEVNNMTKEQLEAQERRRSQAGMGMFGGGPGGRLGSGPGGEPGAGSEAGAQQAESQRPGEGPDSQVAPGTQAELGERPQGQGRPGGGSPDYDAMWERVKERQQARQPGITKEAWIQQMRQREQMGGGPGRGGRSGAPGFSGAPGVPGVPGGSEGPDRPMSGQQTAQPATTSSIIKATGPFYQGEYVLRPGMTANVTIVTNQRSGVLNVPNTALRFNPVNFDPSLAEATGVEAQPRQQQQAFGPPRQTTPADRRARLMDRGFASVAVNRLWILDENGRPKSISVNVGLADPQNTEVSGEGLSEGLEILIGVDESRRQAAASGGSPFQMGTGMRR